MLRGRPATDSTEDSVSSSSSPNNGAAVAEAAAGATDGWHPHQAAAAVAEATSATATATATTTTATTKAVTVRRVGQSRLSSPLTQQQQPALLPSQQEDEEDLLEQPEQPQRPQEPQPQPQHQRARRPARWGHRWPQLRDRAASDESADDADDEADDTTEAVPTVQLPGEAADDANGNDVDVDNVEFEEALEGGMAAVEGLEVDEAEAEEDLRTSEDATSRAWPATNDDYLEFTVAITSAARASATINAAFVGAGWFGRLLGRHDTWRLFHTRRASVAAPVAASVGRRRSGGFWSPVRLPVQVQRRLSLPCKANCGADKLRLADQGASALAAEEVRLPLEAFDRLLSEVAIASGNKGGGCGSSPAG